MLAKRSSVSVEPPYLCALVNPPQCDFLRGTPLCSLPHLRAVPGPCDGIHGALSGLEVEVKLKSRWGWGTPRDRDLGDLSAGSTPAPADATETLGEDPAGVVERAGGPRLCQPRVLTAVSQWARSRWTEQFLDGCL